MIINCNTSKNTKLNEYIEDYYNKYNKNKKYYYENSIYMAKNYNVPSDFNDEFSLLYFYYTHFYKNEIKTINNYIKKVIKNDALTSMLNKIEKNPKLYIELEKLFIKYNNFNNPRSFSCISNSAVLYIFYILKKAIQKTPDWIKESIKYNL